MLRLAYEEFILREREFMKKEGTLRVIVMIREGGSRLEERELSRKEEGVVVK